MPSRDFTDSEPEDEHEHEQVIHKPTTAKGSGSSSRHQQAGGPHQRHASAPEKLGSGSTPTSNTSTKEGNPLRITLRPNLNHLLDTASSSSAPAPAHVPSSDRSSLSPPPPITLKLGLGLGLGGMANPTNPSGLAGGSNTSRSSVAERVDYTSSEDEIGGDPQYTASSSRAKGSGSGPGAGAGAKKAKRPQHQTSQSANNSPRRKAHATFPSPLLTAPSAGAGTGSVPAAHRKSYDWLTPGSAGASHHGPEGRNAAAGEGSEEGTPTQNQTQGAGSKSTPTLTPKISGWSPADGSGSGNGRNEGPAWSGAGAGSGMSPVLSQGQGQGGHLQDLVSMQPLQHDVPKPKRSHKRKSEVGGGGAGGGGGSSNRPKKGQKKGVPLPWKDGSMFYEGHTPNATPQSQSQPQSLEGTPEPDYQSGANDSRLEAISLPRAPTPPPFVLADPEKLGFPVFSKPIAAPKIALSNFPKVTQYFFPNNGGDTRFPRKEAVRSWKQVDRTVVGVGGGQMKFKAWQRGPPSELSRLIQADREVRELQKLNKQANARASLAASQAQSQSGNPAGGGSPSLNRSPHLTPMATSSPDAHGTGTGVSRPELKHSFSTDSLVASALGGETRDDEVSEMGDEDRDTTSIMGGGDTPMAGGDMAGARASPAASGSGSPVASNARTKSGKKARPRKSKLANELIPADE